MKQRQACYVYSAMRTILVLALIAATACGSAPDTEPTSTTDAAAPAEDAAPEHIDAGRSLPCVPYWMSDAGTCPF